MPSLACHRLLVCLLLVCALFLAALPASAAAALPPIVFVARGHLATSDYIFTDELGPPGQLTTGLFKFAPGSKLVVRAPDGRLRVLVDTAQPAGHILNPLGLRDLQSPDVSFDASTIVFAATTGPYLPGDQAGARPRYSWRLYTIGVDGQGLRQLTFDDRAIEIPNHPDAASGYHAYDDLFPAFLADGRVVFSSSRYPSQAHYDGRPTFNLYLVDPDGLNLHRITTERGGALHPTPLPDGRILFSRWWVNFNQPSETGVYSRIDNQPGFEPAYDRAGAPVRSAGGAPVTGSYLPDGTLVYSNTTATFRPARGRLADGTPIRDAPNTWHLMAINPDGSDMRRFVWTPRYAYHLTTDHGHDTYNAAQPAPVFVDGELLVAYVTQRDGTMAHTTFGTGIRIARPGVEHAFRNTTESIAGLRWEAPDNTDSFALHPAGLPDGRILYAASRPDSTLPLRGEYAFMQNGSWYRLRLQAAPLRYELQVIDPRSGAVLPVSLAGDIGHADAVDAHPIVVRPTGAAPGAWQARADLLTAPVSDDPFESNLPYGLIDGAGQPAYAWSRRSIEQIDLAILHNANVYANPPLSLPYVNNSPPLGSVAYADIYIDAPQFTGTRAAPDDQVRAVKWITVPVDERGAFTASVPADTPAFIVLRDRAGRVVRGGNRSAIAIAQGNTPGRPGQVVRCAGCHLGHASGSLDAAPQAAYGWTNVAPSALVRATSEWTNGGDAYYHGRALHLNDRRNYVLEPGAGPGGPYQDRTLPWIAGAGRAAGEVVALVWQLPVALREVRLVGAEPGQAGFSDDYQVYGVLRFYLAGEEIVSARREVGPIAPLSLGATRVTFDAPIAADQVELTISAVAGTYYSQPAPAALSEIEVIGRGATPEALAARPAIVALPLVVAAAP